MRFSDIKGHLFPELHEILVHKSMGITGEYLGTVTVNRGRVHFQVCEIVGGKERNYILPADDWQYQEENHAHSDD